MAKVRTNDLIKAFSGKVGNLVFRTMPNGSVVVSVAPHFHNRKFSKGQKEHQQRFREASLYARQSAKVKPIYGELAKETTKTAYNIALSDWFNPPVIHQVKHKDRRILVEVSDNVLVTKVLFTLLDEEGKIIEEREGLRGNGNWWEYLPDLTGKIITVQAWDMAGNVTKFEYERK